MCKQLLRLVRVGHVARWVYQSGHLSRPPKSHQGSPGATVLQRGRGEVSDWAVWGVAFLHTLGRVWAFTVR